MIKRETLNIILCRLPLRYKLFYYPLFIKYMLIAPHIIEYPERIYLSVEHITYI